jgi:hypothetical protein
VFTGLVVGQALFGEEELVKATALATGKHTDVFDV